MRLHLYTNARSHGCHIHYSNGARLVGVIFHYCILIFHHSSLLFTIIIHPFRAGRTHKLKRIHRKYVLVLLLLLLLALWTHLATLLIGFCVQFNFMFIQLWLFILLASSMFFFIKRSNEMMRSERERERSYYSIQIFYWLWGQRQITKSEEKITTK